MYLLGRKICKQNERTEKRDDKTTCNHTCHYMKTFSLFGENVYAQLLKKSRGTNSPNQAQTTMSSMSFSTTTFSAPIYGCLRTKANPTYAPVWASMASLTTPIKSTLGASQSFFFNNGFSLQPSNLPGFFFKSRSSGVYARAVTDKTLYDFTVKVSVLFCFASTVDGICQVIM